MYLRICMTLRYVYDILDMLVAIIVGLAVVVILLLNVIEVVLPQILLVSCFVFDVDILRDGVLCRLGQVSTTGSDVFGGVADPELAIAAWVLRSAANHLGKIVVKGE